VDRPQGKRISASDTTALKRAAAARAVDFVEPGMKVGLGSGSTADFFTEFLAERVRSGLKIVATPTSEHTAELARRLAIPLGDLNDIEHLDLVVDGADEADFALNLIKGGGGALLREKIVAASAERMIVIVDESKLRPRLGRFPLPIEVLPFGHRTTLARIIAAAANLGHMELAPVLRRAAGAVYRTDNGNFIYDCPFGEIHEPGALATELSQIAGVVEHGLFCGMAWVLIAAGPDGVRLVERSGA
jgi:ribose 5-phosphate isomerase A